MFSLQAKLAAILLGMLALFGTHWKAYTLGKSAEKAIHTAEQLNQKTQEVKQIVEKQQVIVEAQNVKTKKLRIAAAANAGTVADIDRLRVELAAARAEIENSSAQYSAAQRALYDSMAEDIERLASEGARIALEADGHAADSLMCYRAQTE